MAGYYFALTTRVDRSRGLATTRRPARYHPLDQRVTQRRLIGQQHRSRLARGRAGRQARLQRRGHAAGVVPVAGYRDPRVVHLLEQRGHALGLATQHDHQLAELNPQQLGRHRLYQRDLTPGQQRLALAHTRRSPRGKQYSADLVPAGHDSVRPWRAATSSASTATAISAGSRPPRSSPTGPWTRSSFFSSTPRAASSRRRRAWVLRLPSAPT